jgi:hypothetical protein
LCTDSRIDPSISFMLTRCRRYAREYCVQVVHVHVGSSGPKSRAYCEFFRFIRPAEENAVPIRAVRVGSTQSNMSTPRPMACSIVVGLPTPIR